MMTAMDWIATETETGKRTDAWVALACAVSRSRAVALLKAGTLTLNGRTVAPDQTVHLGDLLAGELPAQAVATLAPSPGRVPIVFQDRHLLVVNKPPGLAVHPGAGMPGGTLVNVLLGMKVPLAPAGGVHRPGVVHRLDKDTSGLLVLAKTDAAFWALSKQVMQHAFEREYLAIVAGVPTPRAGTIDAHIGRDSRHREKFTVVSHGGREAVTHYAVDQVLKGASLVRLTLETGRTHQIRVHLAAMGWPVLGDAVYGGVPARTPLLKRQALHAARLGIAHPATGKAMAWTAVFPRDLAAAVKALTPPRTGLRPR